jgi:xylose isomerase
MKTSLGIWAFGRDAPVAETVKRAVDGLGDRIDGYEFHYPQELSPDTLEAVRDALGGHDVYCVAGGLHLDPAFVRGGLVAADPDVRAAAVRLTVEGARFAGELGARYVLWPGVEGYDYPFQAAYADAWRWFVDGVGQAAQACAEHGTELLLEHISSGPAQKVLMRNVGMTLHVIHTLRAQGITNVRVNLDFQHLLMNGEHLPEYAALLDAEGLLGHLHANSGWGPFDDDNMVGTSAFMETLELAVELRRCGYAGRIGFDLAPTDDAVAAVERSVDNWRFIDAVAARIDDAALREAQSRRDAIAASAVVYAALGKEHV